jgi:hypothetical protein
MHSATGQSAACQIPRIQMAECASALAIVASQ